MTTLALKTERHAPPLRWTWIILLFFAALCLPLALAESQWLPGAERLIHVVFWSLLLGFWLAYSPFPNWLAWLVGLTVGITVSLQVVARFVPPPRLFWGDVGTAFSWAWQLVAEREWPGYWPFASSFQYAIGQLGTAFANASEWWVTTIGGGVSKDITVLWFASAYVTWVICWYAAFALVRTEHTLLALLPLGTAIVSNAAVTYIGVGYVRAFAAIMVLMLVYTNATRLERIWKQRGIDFSTELRRDTLVAGITIAAAVLILGFTVPYVTYNRAVFFFWERYGQTLQSFYERLDRAFAGRNPVPEIPSEEGYELAVGLLSHEVGAGSDPSQRVVMVVWISDPPPPPAEDLEQMAAAEGIDPRRFVERRYWRQRTYDVYTGSGWDSSERNVSEWAAGEPWQELDYPHVVVTQTYMLREPHGDIVYAVNAPLTVEDHDYRILHRGEDDFVALSVDALEYRVVSLAPQPTEDELRAAEGEYPPEIAQRYLALPEIPQRVRDLAWEIVTAAGAETRYDKARAIEAYLRRFVYDKEVEPPPLDRDITDYFLFDIQRGYCDYSATAMVVMLRAVGVAARYASGFAMGRYDYALEGWVVTGANAHAWAEVYFPGLGWIEFEPTPTELPREFTRSTEPFVPPDWLPPTAPVSQPAPRTPWWQWAAGGGIGFVLLAAGVAYWVFSRRKETDPRRIALQTYGYLVTRARWLNLAPQGGQTPQEFLAFLARAMERRGHSVSEDLRLIGAAYLKARYSQSPVTPEEGQRVLEAWRRLRPLFVRLLFRPSEMRVHQVT